MPRNHQSRLLENLALRFPFNNQADPVLYNMIADFQLTLENKPEEVTYYISQFYMDGILAVPPWFDALELPPDSPDPHWEEAVIDTPDPIDPLFDNAEVIPISGAFLEIREKGSDAIAYQSPIEFATIRISGRKWITFSAVNATGSFSLTADYDLFQLYDGIVPPESTLLSSVVSGKATNLKRLFIQNFPADAGKPLPPYGELGGPTTLIPITNNIVLRGGYNTAVTLDPTDTDVRREGALTISMNPGDGLGKFVICDNVGIKTINQVNPLNSGDMVVTPTGNLNYERTDVDDNLLNHGMRITNNSNPCCACTDFIDAYVALVNEYNLARRIGYRINIIRDLYKVIRDKVIQEKASREAGLDIKTHLHLRPGRNVVIMAEIRNASNTALAGNTVIKFTIGGGTPTLIASSGLLVTSIALKETTQVDPIPSSPTEYLLYLGSPLAAYAWLQVTFQLTFPVGGAVSCTTSIIDGAVQDMASIYVRGI